LEPLAVVVEEQMLVKMARAVAVLVVTLQQVNLFLQTME
jgi:hypothetical protein